MHQHIHERNIAQALVPILVIIIAAINILKIIYFNKKDIYR